MGENLGYFPIRVEVDASENTSGFVSSRGAMFCQVPATPNPRPNTLTPSPSPSAYPNPSPIPNANPNPSPSPTQDILPPRTRQLLLVLTLDMKQKRSITL